MLQVEFSCTVCTVTLFISARRGATCQLINIAQTAVKGNMRSSCLLQAERIIQKSNPLAEGLAHQGGLTRWQSFQNELA